ncbi:MAG TPA: protein kinase [Gemmatimonadaceae bacterium]|nr:protein kinase [Gemmatimonadaceae bacterium]
MPETSRTIDRLTSAIADRYRITRELGAGGMATVHLAHDMRHERDVAIKVLLPELAAALGAERFLAEIRTTAKLQHPHILPLLDSGAADGFLYYVMPLVTGESLRQRLERERQLPIDDAVRIAREVAAALDYAHRQGVVHRDIKPENILLHDGSALVADFGIALAVQTAAGARMTQTGLSLGTPQYMSPEQAMGERAIDARSDIYSLAAVTYEMLTGEPPFTGATVQAVVAKVMSAEPEAITMTRRNVPPAVAAAVHRGLEKLPADRHGTAAEFAAALTSAGATSATIVRGAPRKSSIARRVAPWLVAAVLTPVAFMAGKSLQPPDESSVQGPVVATLLPDEGEEWAGTGVHLALSADGRHVAVIARRGRESEMIIRSLDSAGSRVIADTKGAFYPFWSPDGKSIGFFDDNELKTVDLATGAVRSLCPAARPGGGSWGADNVILYVPERGVGLHRVTVPNGTCDSLGIVTPPPALDGKPRFLPDGRHFVTSTDMAAWLGEVGGDSLTWLADLQRMRAVVAGPDYLLFRPRGSPSGNIFAQRIDVKNRQLIGEPVKILDDVSTPGGNTALAASHNGVLVGRIDNGGGAGRVFGRFEQRGAIGDTVPGSGLGRLFGNFRLSRDGKRLALGGWEVAVLDIARRATTVVSKTLDGRAVQFPVWSPADTMIAYAIGDSGRMRIDGVNLRTSAVAPLVSDLALGRSVQLTDWSADGRYLVFEYGAGGGSPWSEAWVHDFANGTSRRAFEHAAHIVAPALAPQGGLIAYQVGTSFENPMIHVRPFPGPGSAIRVSPEAGVEPRWSADGTELFWYDDSRGVMAVRINRDASVISPPRVALGLAVLRSIAPTFSGTFMYDPTPDGQAFYGSVVRPRPVNLTVIVDWWKLLERGTAPRP